VATVLVTGGTRLARANVCQRLILRGDKARALVRAPADAEALEQIGVCNVFDAARALGMRRVVALSTGTFLDLSQETPYEQAPVHDNPPSDPYTVTKLEAVHEAIRRADSGEDIAICHPGAIYGPGLFVDRALRLRLLIAWLRQIGKL
jgi:nucleoside-diphosphate-sugar epimerase